MAFSSVERLTITATTEPDSIFLSTCKPRVLYDGKPVVSRPAPCSDPSPIRFFPPEDDVPAPGGA